MDVDIMVGFEATLLPLVGYVGKWQWRRISQFPHQPSQTLSFFRLVIAISKASIWFRILLLALLLLYVCESIISSLIERLLYS